jgi:hypothetical protein
VTQQAVERALGKILTDENFRERFFENPEAASWEAGLALSPIELEALSRVPRHAAVSLHGDLDKRISRPSLDPDRDRGSLKSDHGSLDRDRGEAGRANDAAVATPPAPGSRGGQRAPR